MVRIALFGGLAAPRQGFHYIQHVDNEDDPRDLANYAMITISRGSVMEVDLGTSLPSRVPAFGWLPCRDTLLRLPGGLALGWTTEGSPAD